jgi:hypothetical protein
MLDAELKLPNFGMLTTRIRSWPRRRQLLLGATVACTAAWFFSDFRWWRPDRFFDAGDNVNICEARSWLMGRLDLHIDRVALKYAPTASRPFDSALYHGRVFNIFPPAFTLIAVPLLWIWPQGVPHLALVLLLAVPVPGLAYLLFIRCGSGRIADAVLLTLGLVAGTSLSYVTELAVRGAYVWQLDHVVATIGLLLLLNEYFGRRRVWLAAIGLAIAVWSRQLALAYVLPLFWMAWHVGESRSETAPIQHASITIPHSPRRLRLAGAAAAVAVIVAVPATLSALKFGSPFDPGYQYIYVGRDDHLARYARHGLFTTHFLARNALLMNLGLPHITQIGGYYVRQRDDGRLEYGHNPRLSAARWFYTRPNSAETGIWWTSPILLYLLIDLRRIWRDPQRRMLLLAAASVYTALLFYHTTGGSQPGCNRFSLDFVPAMMALIAPYVHGPRRRWITPVLIGWSLLYFQGLLAPGV